MKVSDKDAKLFFDLMWGLQYYVNKEYKIHTKIKSLEEYIDCSTEVKMEVRSALYSNIAMVDSYVEKNPLKLSKDKLKIISAWKNCVRGNFYIERYLKRYAIFIEDEDVYGVLGLYNGFDQMIPKSRLPLYVETVLLPFNGKIIYDGLLQGQNFFFGKGIKDDLKESYLRAKQNNRIIESLDTAANSGLKKEASKKKSSKDWRPELNELAKASKKLRGKATDPAIFSPAFSLVKTSIEFAQIAVSNVNDQGELHNALNKVRRAFNKSSTILDRQEY